MSKKTNEPSDAEKLSLKERAEALRKKKASRESTYQKKEASIAERGVKGKLSDTEQGKEKSTKQKALSTKRPSNTEHVLNKKEVSEAERLSLKERAAILRSKKALEKSNLSKIGKSELELEALETIALQKAALQKRVAKVGVTTAKHRVAGSAGSKISKKSIKPESFKNKPKPTGRSR